MKIGRHFHFLFHGRRLRAKGFPVFLALLFGTLDMIRAFFVDSKHVLSRTRWSIASAAPSAGSSSPSRPSGRRGPSRSTGIGWTWLVRLVRKGRQPTERVRTTPGTKQLCSLVRKLTQIFHSCTGVAGWCTLTDYRKMLNLGVQDVSCSFLA